MLKKIAIETRSIQSFFFLDVDILRYPMVNTNTGVVEVCDYALVVVVVVAIVLSKSSSNPIGVKYVHELFVLRDISGFSLFVVCCNNSSIYDSSVQGTSSVGSGCPNRVSISPRSLYPIDCVSSSASF